MRGKKKDKAGSDYTPAVRGTREGAKRRNLEKPYKKQDFHSTKKMTRE